MVPSDLKDLKIYHFNKKAPPLIVKPEAASQGKGIFITRRLEDITAAQMDLSYGGNGLVVQRYLKNPYLLDGHKFDFRIYVLITSCDPLRIFVYNDGMARLATEPYKPNCYENLLMHLTNYAINKEAK